MFFGLMLNYLVLLFAQGEANYPMDTLAPPPINFKRVVIKANGKNYLIINDHNKIRIEQKQTVKEKITAWIVGDPPGGGGNDDGKWNSGDEDHCPFQVGDKVWSDHNVRWGVGEVVETRYFANKPYTKNSGFWGIKVKFDSGVIYGKAASFGKVANQ